MEDAAQEHQRAVSQITEALNQSGHPAEPADVIPQNAQTPVPESEDMKEVGGEVVGGDLAHVLGTTVGDMTTGASKVRTTKSRRFLGTLVDRLLRKKGPNEELVEK